MREGKAIATLHTWVLDRVKAFVDKYLLTRDPESPEYVR
jgi:hypothetical protein